MTPLRVVGENLPIPGAGLRWVIGAAVGVLSFVAGSAATYQTYRDNATVAAAHQIEFEKAVWDKFSAEAKLRDEKLAALDKAANERSDNLNLKIDQVAASVGVRFERFDRLAETRGDRLGAAENRLTALEAKICYLAGVRCK